MSTYVARTAIGHIIGDPPTDEPTYAAFDSVTHCCEGCEEGHDGKRESAGPVKVTVAYNEDRWDAGHCVEVRFESFGNPQILYLDRFAADELAGLLRHAADGGAVAGHWRAER